jgi:hypothetical protein
LDPEPVSAFAFYFELVLAIAKLGNRYGSCQITLRADDGCFIIAFYEGFGHILFYRHT